MDFPRNAVVCFDLLTKLQCFHNMRIFGLRYNELFVIKLSFLKDESYPFSYKIRDELVTNSTFLQIYYCYSEDS